jgi:hypothetical protein
MKPLTKSWLGLRIAKLYFYVRTAMANGASLSRELARRRPRLFSQGPQLSWAWLSPDGAQLLYPLFRGTALSPPTPIRLMRLRVDGGVPKLVLESEKWEGVACARVPANLCVLIEDR